MEVLGLVVTLDEALENSEGIMTWIMQIAVLYHNQTLSLTDDTRFLPKFLEGIGSQGLRHIHPATWQGPAPIGFLN